LKWLKSWGNMYNATDSDLAVMIKDLLSTENAGNLGATVNDIQQAHIKKTMPTPGAITEQKQLFYDAFGNPKIVYLDAEGKIRFEDPQVKQKAEPKKEAETE